MRAALLVLALASGCTERDPVAAQLAEGERYLDDGAFRRVAMERALANHDNSYSRQRLASYGLGDRGWDRLPEWSPRSRPILAEDAAAMARAGLAGLATRPAPTALWDGERPRTMDGWIALGREVFFGYPLRAEPLVEYALGAPTFAAEVGVVPLIDGSYPGLRAIVDLDGQLRIGITCALCHAAVEHGELVAGRARRDFDYGKLRIAYHAATGVPVDADLLRRMATWGPGRADVTQDDEDPVAIPDLWGLAAQSALTQAGTIRQDASPIALALRQETQLLDANHQRIRPPRELALALAFYVRSLSPPSHAHVPSDEIDHGATLFARHCGGCHENAAYGGAPVSAVEVGTDPALADGSSRGTGRYRPPALLDVARAAPYLHHGAVPSLPDLLSPARFQPDYVGTLGRGAVPGHAYGTTLPEADRLAVVAFLRIL